MSRTDTTPKTWRAWTALELFRLEDLRAAGKTVAACAADLGRTYASVKIRVQVEGFERAKIERAAWIAALGRPHDISAVAADMGVSYHAVKRRKHRLRAEGVSIFRCRKGPTPTPAPTVPAEPRRMSSVQQALAATHVYLSESIARAMSRRCPWFAEAAESAAMVGLCEAALAFDPACGARFSTFAGHRVRGAVLDAMRAELPKGFRRDKDHAAAIGSLDADLGDGSTLADAQAADELPVGWEIESEDAVCAISRALPARHGLAVRTLFTRADAVTMNRTARWVGVSESRVSQLLTESASLLGQDHRERAGDVT